MRLADPYHRPVTGTEARVCSIDGCDRSRWVARGARCIAPSKAAATPQSVAACAPASIRTLEEFDAEVAAGRGVMS